MIDIHSHIVYGVDDGSNCLQTSLEMLRLAAASGTTDIVATPHANAEYEFRPEVIGERIREIQSLSPDIRVHTGCDFHLNYENVEDAFANPHKYTVNHLNYLLVEFPDGAMIPNIDDIFERFLDMGITPIITHPERNWVIQHNLPQFAKWVELGALVQVTGGSLTGRFGKPAKAFAERILDARQCHFIASDAHDAVDRHPRLVNSYERVREKWGDELAEWLFVENGRSVINGTPIQEMPASAAKKRKRWFFF